MITWTYQDYKLANLFIPTALSILTSIILWILPKKSYLFVIDHVLGIHKCICKLSKSDKDVCILNKSLDDIEGHPLIQKVEGNIYEKILDLQRIRSCRFFIWFLTSLTISLLWIIIFQKLILSNLTIPNAEQCPPFISDCFVLQNRKDITPYTCKPGQIVNVSVQESIYCFKWVYNNKGMSDILETFGICGGLLGIISSILPFLYNLFSYKKYYPCSISYGLICICILGILSLQKINISFLTWFVIYLITGLNILALLCVLITVPQERKLEKVIKNHSHLRSMRRANIRRRKRTTVNVISEYLSRPVYESYISSIRN